MKEELHNRRSSLQLDTAKNQAASPALLSGPRVFDVRALPGISVEDWKTLIQPDSSVVDTTAWKQLSLSERVQQEREAVRSYFKQKSPEYRCTSSLSRAHGASSCLDFPGSCYGRLQ